MFRRGFCTLFSLARKEENMNAHDVNEVKVYPLGNRTIIHVPGGRGEELRIHLESHGIQSKLSATPWPAYQRLEIAGDVDLDTIQALVDHWE
jgi:hypothetical protein